MYPAQLQDRVREAKLNAWRQFGELTRTQAKKVRQCVVRCLVERDHILAGVFTQSH
jgi:hypothetical protein